MSPVRRVLLFALLASSLPALAQYDAGGQNTHGANTDASKLDPATKARIRTEGVISGIPGGQKSETQNQTGPQKEGDAAAGASAKDTGQQGGGAGESAKEKASPAKAR